jgi:hypothetical protein
MIPMHMIKDVAEQHVADLRGEHSRRSRPGMSTERNPTGMVAWPRSLARRVMIRRRRLHLVWWRVRTPAGLGCVPDQA